MRLALIADIHGNIDALEAVLTHIESQRVDSIVNLGDVVSGPMQPHATVQRLAPLGIPTIRGNHERQMLTLPFDRMGESDRMALRALTPAELDWLAAFPETLALDHALLCHGTPRSDVDYLLETLDESGCRAATAEEVEQRVALEAKPLIACAHSHKPRAVRLADGRLVVNPGSVGLQAYPARWPHSHLIENHSPHARYAVATRSNGIWHAEFHQVVYNWEAAAQTAEANSRPDWAHALRTGRIS